MTLIAMGKFFRDAFGASVFFVIPSDAENISSLRVREAHSLGFEVFRYRSKVELEDFARRNAVTHTYVFSGGRRKDLPYFDPKDPESYRIAETIHITHVVFRNYDPHGEVYGYVSDWLYLSSLRRYFLRHAISKLRPPRNHRTLILPLPHFIDWVSEPKINDLDLRARFGISESDYIIGRIGGFEQFDDKAAQLGIIKLLNQNSNYWVFCVNTRKFYEHPRLIYLAELGRSDVFAFYRDCDVLINGRRMGESFGYSIVEPLSLGKPVIAAHWIRNPFMDRNHVSLLSEAGALYKSSNHLVRLIKKFSSQGSSAFDWANLVTKYKRDQAMKPLIEAIPGLRRE